MSSITTVPVFVLAAVVAEAACVLGKKEKVPVRLERKDYHYTQGLTRRYQRELRGLPQNAIT